MLLTEYSSRAPVQSLPFTVRPARTEEDFAALCSMRSEAYARHDYTASLAGRLAYMDAHDRKSTLLIALDKVTGDCLGTQRINFSDRGPTPIAEDENLEETNGESFAYIDRFAVANVTNHVEIRLALMKAMWLHVCEEESKWVVASALAPLVRLYKRVGLRPLRGNEEGKIHATLHETKPYFTIGGRIEELLDNVERSSPGGSRFFVTVRHPDIEHQWPPMYFADPKRSPIAKGTIPLPAEQVSFFAELLRGLGFGELAESAPNNLAPGF